MKFLKQTLLSILLLLVIASPAMAANLSAFAHVENIGDMNSTTGPSISIGTTGQGLQMEGFTLKTDDPSVVPVYEAHVEDYGWMPAVRAGEFAGTRGEHKRIECFKINLEGINAANYDIWYRAHVQDYGWLDWAKNGESSGTSNHAFRCEALELKLTPKNSAAPGATDVPAVEAYSREEGENMFYVNMLRMQNGAGKLTGDPVVHEITVIRANELKANYSHTRPDGRDCFSAIDDYELSHGITNRIGAAAENICAYGGLGINPLDSYTWWSESPGHRTNMLNGNYRYMGYVSVSHEGGNPYHSFAAQEFANR